MNYSDYNDYELIYMVRENDDFSYDVLFNKYIPIIKRLAYEFYNLYKGYGYDYDDFIQEGYLAFQRALSVYDQDKDCLFYTFLLMCIKRRLMSFCRTITNDKKNISNINLIDIDKLYDYGDCFVDKTIINTDCINSIWKIVYDFDIEYISVFELRFNGFSFREISRLLDISLRKSQLLYSKVNSCIKENLKIYM